MSGTECGPLPLFWCQVGLCCFDELLLAEASSRSQSAWKWEVTSDREELVIVSRRVQSHCKLGSAC